MARDRYLSLDRLTRHGAEAIERIDRRIAAARASGHKIGLMKLVLKRSRLLKTLDYETARLNKHIQNIERPPIQRKTSKKREWR
jgi:hypothetical protein